MKHSILPILRSWRTVYAKNIFLLSALLLFFSSCENAQTVAPALIAFEGTYAVQETKPEDNYLLTLHKKANTANTLTLENLANLVKSPLEVRTAGDKLYIAEQAFTNAIGMQYTISGDGKMTNDVLALHYTIKGYNGYSGAVYAKKQAGSSTVVSGK